MWPTYLNTGSNVMVYVIRESIYGDHLWPQLYSCNLIKRNNVNTVDIIKIPSINAKCFDKDLAIAIIFIGEIMKILR